MFDVSLSLEVPSPVYLLVMDIPLSAAGFPLFNPQLGFAPFITGGIVEIVS